MNTMPSSIYHPIHPELSRCCSTERIGIKRILSICVITPTHMLSMRLGRTANTPRRTKAYDLDGCTESTSRKPGFRNVLPGPRWKELRYPVMDLGDHEARIPGSKSASAAAVSRLMEATLQSSGHAGLESETKWSRFSSSHAPHSLLLPLLSPIPPRLATHRREMRLRAGGGPNPDSGSHAASSELRPPR
jgi:hypothetical protein